MVPIYIGRRQNVTKTGSKLLSPQFALFENGIALVLVGKDDNLSVSSGSWSTARVRHVISEELSSRYRHTQVAVVRNRRIRIVVRTVVLRLIPRQKLSVNLDREHGSLPGHHTGRSDHGRTVIQDHPGRSRLTEGVLFVFPLRRPAEAYFHRESERKVVVQDVAQSLAQVQSALLRVHLRLDLHVTVGANENFILFPSGIDRDAQPLVAFEFVGVRRLKFIVLLVVSSSTICFELFAVVAQLRDRTFEQGSRSIGRRLQILTQRSTDENPTVFVTVAQFFGMGSYRISKVGVGRPILDDRKSRFKVKADYGGNE